MNHVLFANLWWKKYLKYLILHVDVLICWIYSISNKGKDNGNLILNFFLNGNFYLKPNAKKMPREMLELFLMEIMSIM